MSLFMYAEFLQLPARFGHKFPLCSDCTDWSPGHMMMGGEQSYTADPAAPPPTPTRASRHTSVSHEEARDSIKLLDITRVLFWLKDFNIILRRKDSTFKFLWHLKMYFYSFPPLIQHAVQLSSIIKPKIL